MRRCVPKGLQGKEVLGWVRWGLREGVWKKGKLS